MPRILTASWDQNRSWILRKWIVTIMVFVIGIAGVILVVTPAVASAKMNFFGEEGIDGVNKSITDMIGLGDDKDNPVTTASGIMSGNWGDYSSQEVSGETMKAANELLGGKSDVWQKFFWDYGLNGVQPIVTQITNGIAVFGGMLCFVYFLKSIIDEMAKGTADFDAWLKIFVRMSIAALVIANINAITNIAQGLAVVIGNFIKTTMEPLLAETKLNALSGGALEDAANGKPAIVRFFNAIGQILSLNMIRLLICYFACGIQNFLLYAFSFGLFFEIAIRKCFMPIAVANLFADEGFRGSGARYIKKYFATCLRIALLILISQMAQIAQWQMIIHPWRVVGGSADNIANFKMLPLLAVPVAAHALYGKASSFADEIVGVY